MSNGLVNHIVELGRRIAELERRNRNRRRTGVIEEVDLKKGLARVKFSDKPKPYIGPWVPWQEVAHGGIKTHFAPTKGEQVDVVSESGDLTDAIITMSTPSDQNKRPHDGPEAVITHGKVRITISDEEVTIKGDVKIEGKVDIEGEHVKHNGRRIDDQHKHEDVEPGTGVSGVPEA